MRLEWIEDILAVADTGSLIKAAERRCLTQSAFSRRIRTIEDSLGTELFDRSFKPVELRAAVRDQRQEMEELATRLRALASGLRDQRRSSQRRIVLASQHAITTAIAPFLVRLIVATHDFDIRLRSANRDECYALLLTRQADIVLFYATDRHPLPMETNFVELHDLGSENLIPVFQTARMGELDAALDRGELPVVVYPRGVFFGSVVGDEVWPNLPKLAFKPRAETALTLAALQFAMIGVAVAWIPETLARAHLASGDLVDLSTRLGSRPLKLAAVRLRGARSQTEQDTWETILSCGANSLSAEALGPGTG